MKKKGCIIFIGFELICWVSDKDIVWDIDLKFYTLNKLYDFDQYLLI